MKPLPALLMLPPHGDSQVEAWLASARLAAAADLTGRLVDHPAFDPILVLAAAEEDRAALSALGGKTIQPSGATFHFGTVLCQVIEAHGLEEVAYFGGASAPLLLRSHLDQALEKLRIDDRPRAVVNNLYSTDWILLNQAGILRDFVNRFPSDNPLGWVLATEAGIRVEAMAAEAATRLDIDTPVDVALLRSHMAVGHHVTQVVNTLDPKLGARVDRMMALLRTPASSLAVIGRCSASVWRMLEERTQIWIRMFVEERGMVASRRLAENGVKSLIGKMVDRLGPVEFLEWVQDVAQGLLWDNRVWMGMEQSWPDPADRFASDLGLVGKIKDARLRNLTQAVNDTNLAVLMGGYGVVSGGVYALLETSFG
jgi:hypothetical protein